MRDYIRNHLVLNFLIFLTILTAVVRIFLGRPSRDVFSIWFLIVFIGLLPLIVSSFFGIKKTSGITSSELSIFGIFKTMFPYSSITIIVVLIGPVIWFFLNVSNMELEALLYLFYFFIYIILVYCSTLLYSIIIYFLYKNESLNKLIKILAFLLLLPNLIILAIGFFTSCGNPTKESVDYICFAKKAFSENDPMICDKLTYAPFWHQGNKHEIYTRSAACLINYAILSKDASLCDVFNITENGRTDRCKSLVELNIQQNKFLTDW